MSDGAFAALVVGGMLFVVAIQLACISDHLRQIAVEQRMRNLHDRAREGKP